MSQEENVEVLRRFSEHFSRTGETDFSVIDPDAVFDNSNAIFDGAVYRGHDGVRAFESLLWGMWQGMRFEPLEFIAAGEDRVIVPVRMVMRGRDEIETVRPLCDPLHVVQGEDHSCEGLSEQGRRRRSRGAAGVADVSGE